MSNSKSSGAGPFTADGNIPGAPDAPVTDLVSRPDSLGQRSRPTDLIQNPLAQGSLDATSIRDFTAEQGPSPSDMLGPDHDVRKEDLPIDGSGKGPIPDPPAGTRGCGSINETAVPFRDLHADKRTR